MKERGGLAGLAREIDGDLRAIRLTMRKPLDAAIARGGLTAPQRGIMQILVESEGLSLKELSARAGLAHSTVSGIVDRLEARGMAVREAHEGDARISRIVAAEAVRQFVKNELPDLAAQPLVKALKRASPADRKKIVEGVRTLRRVLA